MWLTELQRKGNPLSKVPTLTSANFLLPPPPMTDARPFAFYSVSGMIQNKVAMIINLLESAIPTTPLVKLGLRIDFEGAYQSPCIQVRIQDILPNYLNRKLMLLLRLKWRLFDVSRLEPTDPSLGPMFGQDYPRSCADSIFPGLESIHLSLGPGINGMASGPQSCARFDTSRPWVNRSRSWSRY